MFGMHAAHEHERKDKKQKKKKKQSASLLTYLHTAHAKVKPVLVFLLLCSSQHQPYRMRETKANNLNGTKYIKYIGSFNESGGRGKQTKRKIMNVVSIGFMTIFMHMYQMQNAKKIKLKAKQKKSERRKKKTRMEFPNIFRSQLVYRFAYACDNRFLAWKWLTLLPKKLLFFLLILHAARAHQLIYACFDRYSLLFFIIRCRVVSACVFIASIFCSFFFFI